MSKNYQAILMIAYGGPEKPEDIGPFLGKVSEGRAIPPERLEEVAHHYELIGGRSPLNEITFKQAKGLENQLNRSGFDLPVYVGMRNWHPLLSETVLDLSRAGIKKVIGIIMAAHQSDASWERYQRDVEKAISTACVELTVDYIEPLYSHPLYIRNSADRVAECLEQIPRRERENTVIVFTAHSIPTPMAEESPYTEQLRVSCTLISKELAHKNWMLAYQSRSGSPGDPWLEPDILDVIRDLAKTGVSHVVIQPIGFLCDHVEVLYDIGIEAAEVAEEIGINLLTAKTVNDDPTFIKALEDLVKKQILDGKD